MGLTLDQEVSTAGLTLLRCIESATEYGYSSAEMVDMFINALCSGQHGLTGELLQIELRCSILKLAAVTSASLSEDS